MRRFIRFMSEAELEKYLKGEPLINEKEHKKGGSVGFCFFDATDMDPITAHHVLSGIATLEYMVEFMVEDDAAERILTKSEGRYHLPDTPLYEGHNLTEYCTKSYSRDDFLPYQIWHLMISYPAIYQGEPLVINMEGAKRGR